MAFLLTPTSEERVGGGRGERELYKKRTLDDAHAHGPDDDDDDDVWGRIRFSVVLNKQ